VVAYQTGVIIKYSQRAFDLFISNERDYEYLVGWWWVRISTDAV